MKLNKYDKVETVYKQIFDGLNGYTISLLEKEKREKQEPIFKDILYGEVPLGLLYALFVLPPTDKYIQKSKVFYDLGSGIGNAVIGAYLAGFEKSVGIEIMETLYQTSLIAKKRMNESKGVTFIKDDILNVDFSEADVILFCCPTKDEHLRNEMEAKFENLKKDTLILSLIHQIKSPHFELLDHKLVKVAWGETHLFSYIKN